MPLSIGSNIDSLRAQRRLADGTAQLSKTFERLSSGMRINSASDDAAGLSISESLRADRRVFQQGVRNLNDGISLLSIADSAIESLSSIVVRLKELAEQSANGTYSGLQRSALDQEAQALSREYLRVAQSTRFNGLELFNGNFNSLRLQAGYGLDGGIESDIGGAKGTGNISSTVTTAMEGFTQTIESGDINGDGIQDLISGTYGGQLVIRLGTGNGSFNTVQSFTSSYLTVQDVALGDFNNDGIPDITTANFADANEIFIGNGDGTFTRNGVIIYNGSAQSTVSTGDFNGDGKFDIVGTLYGSATVSYGRGDGTFNSPTTVGIASTAFRVGDFNNDGIDDLAGGSSVALGSSAGLLSGTSITAASISDIADFNGDGNLDLITNVSGNTVYAYLGNGDGTFSSAISSAVTINNGTRATAGDFNGDGKQDLLLTGVATRLMLGNGDGTFGSASTLSVILAQNPATGDFNEDGVIDAIGYTSGSTSTIVALGETTKGIGALLPFDLGTQIGARQALPEFDRLIAQLASQRGRIGAFQARIQVGVNNLQTAAENYAAADSRIRNADIASESSDLVRLNILQQAAASVLSQANLQPNIALSLLSTD